jgi:hypothetical protein
VERLTVKQKVQKWLTLSLEDPIAKILVQNSNLTKTQVESLLIDVLAENMAPRPLKYEEKGSFRLIKAGVSRGAFNRSLRQARTNVIQAIYTILLLGYLGVLDSIRLASYLEISDKLQAYMDAYRETAGTSKVEDEHLRVMHMLRDELMTTLKGLAKPKSMSQNV